MRPKKPQIGSLPDFLTPGIFKDNKRKKRLNADEFIRREASEWVEALGVFAKEVVGGKPKSKDHILILGGDRIGRNAASLHDFKRRQK